MWYMGLCWAPHLCLTISHLLSERMKKRERERERERVADGEVERRRKIDESIGMKFGGRNYCQAK